MEYQVYISKKAAEEPTKYMELLKRSWDKVFWREGRSSRTLLGVLNGAEIYFVREGLCVGHFEMERYTFQNGKAILTRTDRTLSIDLHELYYATASAYCG